MKTPEEYAEELVQVTPYEPDDGTYWLRFSGHRDSPPATGEANLYGNREDAEYDAAIHRRTIAGVIRLAIEDAHAAWMARTPNGMTEGRLKWLGRFIADNDGEQNHDRRMSCQELIPLLKELRRHIQHQAALIEDIAQLSSEYTEARERIRKEAFLEGKQAAIDAVNKWVDELNERYKHSQTGSYGPWLRNGVVGAINDVPDSPP